MAAALKNLFNKRQLALTHAQLRAWWEGEEFDKEAALAAIEAKLAATAANDAESVEGAEGAEEELFDYELPGRLAALGFIWGAGRIRPGDDGADKLELARVGAPADGAIAVLGPGMASPIIALAGAHPGKLEVFEWREETFDALRHGVREAALGARVSVTRIDLEAHVFTPNAFDGLLSLDDFAYCGYPPHLAQQIFKCLKPGARAVVECYVGPRIDLLKTAFASSFAEPQIRTRAEIGQFLADVGFVLEAEEDLTDEFLATARNAFKGLGERLTADLDVMAARELAWEVEAWRARMRLLARRRLERRRFIVVKPAEAPAENAQAENENAPAG